MDTLEAIITRRSIRQYTPQNIPEDKIKLILQSAMYAPSAMNYQPWHFIVIDKKDTIEGLQSIFLHADMLKQATLLIIVCGDSELEKSIDNLVQDCSAATENALISIHALGLGGIWLSIYPNRDVINGLKKTLELPENIIPLTAIPIGFPAEVKESENRYNTTRIHSNKW
ncbi:MAG: nitroreductase family protein [Ignavibacteriaceae bacterium]